MRRNGKILLAVVVVMSCIVGYRMTPPTPVRDYGLFSAIRALEGHADFDFDAPEAWDGGSTSPLPNSDTPEPEPEPEPQPLSPVKVPAARPAMPKKQLSDFEKEVRQKWRNAAGLYKDKTKHPEFGSAVMITIVNSAYEKIFDNWRCFAEKQGLDFMLFSFDKKALSFWADDKSVLIPGPETEGQIMASSKRFDVMGCQKVDAVLALLEAGADVIIADSDCVFKKSLLSFFKQMLKYDLHYQPNHPECKKFSPNNAKGTMDPACFLINSGFYYVSGRKPETFKLFERVRDECYNSAGAEHVSPTDGPGDQRALQRTFNGAINIPTHFYGNFHSKLRDIPKGWKDAKPTKDTFYKSARFCGSNPNADLPEPTFEYCPLQPHLYPAGKNKRNPGTMILYHANHMKGGVERKIIQLTRMGLWKGDSPTC